MKLLGVQIANGFSPEARVFAGLLQHGGDAYNALVLHQDWATDAAGSATQFEEHSGVRLARMDFGWRPNFDRHRSVAGRVASQVYFRYALRQALREAREYDPDVIYSCQQKWDCRAASYIARRLNRPHVVHLHYTIGPWLGGQALHTLRFCDHVVAVSDFIRGEALRHGVAPEKVTTLLNSIVPLRRRADFSANGPRKSLGIPDDAPLAGIVARVSEDKGHEDTVEAFALTAQLIPEARLLVVGEGVARPKTEAMVAAKGLANRVIFAGRRSDVPEILAALDVFIHPSRRDPCPLAVLEAAAAGLPIVAYAEGGIPELVVQGETGLLAPAEDRTALGDALTTLLSDRALAVRMGEAAVSRIANQFQPEKAGATFAELMSGVAARPLAVASGT